MGREGRGEAGAASTPEETGSNPSHGPQPPPPPPPGGGGDCLPAARRARGEQAPQIPILGASRETRKYAW